MKLGAMRGLTAGICLMAEVSLTAATPAQAGEARSGGSAAKRVGPLLLAWGDNFDGELGDGTVMDRHAPVAVNPPAGLKATSARVGSFAAAVTPSGQLMAWGRGTEGELGNGAMKDRHRPVQVKLPKGVKIKAVRVGFDFAVAVTTTGRVYAWGLGTSGQLGNGEQKSSDLPVRVDLPRGVRVKAVSAGANSAIALTSTGRVLAWGDNHEGQLGNGRTRTSGRPVWVKIPRATRITAVGAGVGQMFAVTASGGLLAWGSNASFVLGDGKTGIRRVPVHVLLPKKVRVVAAFGGLLHSLALTAGGRVLAWGDNEGGQLGDGTMENHKLPAFVHIPRSVRIATPAAGRYFSLALTSTGKVWAWGDDSSGELGDGLNMARATPFQVSLPGTVLAIGSGCEASSSMAVVTNVKD